MITFGTRVRVKENGIFGGGEGVVAVSLGDVYLVFFPDGFHSLLKEDTLEVI